MAVHTPGPWIVGTKPGVWTGPVVKADGGNKGVAFVVGPPAVDEANARLIAAAPEMLAVLRCLRDDMKSLAFFDAGNIENYLAGIESAIAKAEGRE